MDISTFIGRECQTFRQLTTIVEFSLARQFLMLIDGRMDLSLNIPDGTEESVEHEFELATDLQNIDILTLLGYSEWTFLSFLP